jgi:hypothetical protein
MRSERCPLALPTAALVLERDPQSTTESVDNQAKICKRKKPAKPNVAGREFLTSYQCPCFFAAGF